MQDHIHIYDLLTPEEVAEHRHLTILLKRDKGEPLTIAEVAQLCGCSEAAVYATQQDALTKLRNQHPELKDHLQN